MAKDTQTIDARRWLNRAWMLEMEINALLAMKEETHDRVTSITSSVADVRVSGTHDVHKLDRLVELEDKIDRCIDNQIAIKEEIFDVIQRITERRFRTLLINRYIRFMTWEHIAVEMNYGYRHIHKMHRIALYLVAQELEKMALNGTIDL